MTVQIAAVQESGNGPSRKWCHPDAMSEMHRLVDVGLLATVMKKVKPPNTKVIGPTHDVLVAG